MNGLGGAGLIGEGEAEARGQPLPAAQAVESRDQDGTGAQDEACDDLEGNEHKEEDEEEEEEPRLKYQRVGSSVTEVLRQDAASCLCVSDKLLALGTHDGTIHVLDFAGNEVTYTNFWLNLHARTVFFCTAFFIQIQALDLLKDAQLWIA